MGTGAGGGVSHNPCPTSAAGCSPSTDAKATTDHYADDDWQNDADHKPCDCEPNHKPNIHCQENREGDKTCLTFK